MNDAQIMFTTLVVLFFVTAWRGCGKNRWLSKGLAMFFFTLLFFFLVVMPNAN